MPLVFLDTETSGLHPDRRVWEVAMIRRDAKGQREATIQISDVDLTTAEPMGLKVGRFYERHHRFADGAYPTDFEMLSSSWPFAHNPLSTVYRGTEADTAFVVERWTRGAHIIGAVPNFDTECLAAMLRRHRLAPSWHYHLVDIENVAVGWLRGRMEPERTAKTRAGATAFTIDPEFLTPPWKSDELSRACGIEPPGDDERHTAMGDARWVMRWWDRLMGGDAT